MDKLKEKICEVLSYEMQILRYENQGYMDWIKCKSIIENRILPVVFQVANEEFNLLNYENIVLKTKINQFSFNNDPERDKTIVELFRKGMSRGKISKHVGMSKWGVSKALRRLGVN